MSAGSAYRSGCAVSSSLRNDISRSISNFSNVYEVQFKRALYVVKVHFLDNLVDEPGRLGALEFSHIFGAQHLFAHAKRA